MTACFCRKAISAEWDRDVNLIDHRYFYRDNGHGSYTCGLVRDAAANKLLELEINFADTDFLSGWVFDGTRCPLIYQVEGFNYWRGHWEVYGVETDYGAVRHQDRHHE